MTDLHEMKCVACRAGKPTLTEGKIYMLHAQVSEWQVKKMDGMKRLERVFEFKNFVEALEFRNKIGAIGAEQDHHRLIVTEWGKLFVGTPPISTDEDPFVFYHGGEGADADHRYHARTLLLDREDLDKILCRSPRSMLLPGSAAETTGW
jgi:4a-hydroxytetrahydrobiopterin dehydratase